MKYSRIIFLCSFLIVNCYLLTVHCFADSEFSLRIAPVLQAPLAEELINPGIGANVSLDWAFWNFAPRFTLTSADEQAVKINNLLCI